MDRARLKSWGLPGPEPATRPPASSRTGGPHGSRRAARQRPYPLRERLDVHRHGSCRPRSAGPARAASDGVRSTAPRAAARRRDARRAGSRSGPGSAHRRPRSDSGTAPRSEVPGSSVQMGHGVRIERAVEYGPGDSTSPSPASPSPPRGLAGGCPAPSPALPSSPIRVSLISSLASSGSPSSAASGAASELLPDPGGPATSTNIGCVRRIPDSPAAITLVGRDIAGPRGP